MFEDGNSAPKQGRLTEQVTTKFQKSQDVDNLTASVISDFIPETDTFREQNRLSSDHEDNMEDDRDSRNFSFR